MTKIATRLALSNLLVFLSVLGVFSAAVYLFWQHESCQELEKELSRLADAVIASIDFDESDAGQPDLLTSSLPDEASRSLLNLRLQWFDPQGKLVREKGQLKLSLPFDRQAALQVQSFPHALLLTRPALVDGRLLGYARVAEPLIEADQSTAILASGLALGVAIALCVASLGIFWLVREALCPIQDNMRRLRQFTGDASHELRNPIMAIKSNSSVALKYDRDMRAGDREKFLSILDAANQMEQLTNELLALASAEREEARSAPGKLNLASLVTDVLSELHELAKPDADDVVLSVDLPTQLTAQGNSTELKRLFRNIIENALLYSPRPAKIAIHGSSSATYATVRIEDQGIGISPEDLQRVFDRFWRADRARSRQRGGTGLGLAIAQAIAEKHGGKISVASQPGKGSCFTVCLPS